MDGRSEPTSTWGKIFTVGLIWAVTELVVSVLLGHDQALTGMRFRGGLAVAVIIIWSLDDVLKELRRR